MSNNWMQYVQNPRSFALKKFMFELIKDRFPKHEQLFDRVSHYLVTDPDVQQFSQMIMDVYESAYLKAVEDHRDALAKAGLKATVVNQKQK